jgi:hypothetical protein
MQTFIIRWIGALFFFIINAGKGKFRDYHNAKFETRNLIVGYLFNLLIVAGIILTFVVI